MLRILSSAVCIGENTESRRKGVSIKSRGGERFPVRMGLFTCMTPVRYYGDHPLVVHEIIMFRVTKIKRNIVARTVRIQFIRLHQTSMKLT